MEISEMRSITSSAEAFEYAANICERMVVGGLVWNAGQSIASEALLDAAKAIRGAATRLAKDEHDVMRQDLAIARATIDSLRTLLTSCETALEEAHTRQLDQCSSDKDDALRYRWLRDHSDATWRTPQVFGPCTLRIEIPFWMFRGSLPASSLDRVIDVARGLITEEAAEELLRVDSDNQSSAPVGTVIEGFTDAMGHAAHIASWSGKTPAIGTKLYTTPQPAAPAKVLLTDDLIDYCAKELERQTSAKGMGWTDDQLETWWNVDPYFNDNRTGWSWFTGTRKEKALEEARIILTAALDRLDRA